ncbi:pentapeptide repeat-containing protein [Paenibacillus antibioticophila]|uniref:pentapeptide repeat-containing protein n=1 Tax=Paenibacillus antibioticophila TaxID=1274374 RepID=UPI0005C86445|nr:pentapeptide repeat-containing protein [Paenibacillus antibioticophila]
MAGQGSERDEILLKISLSIHEKNIIKSMDISEIDLTFADLSELIADQMIAIGVKLRASSMMRTSFRDCNFSSADFQSCNLENADFADCYFRDTDFTKSIMRFAKIKISFCDRACFDQVDLTDGDLYDSIFNGSTFRNANLTGINAKYASFRDVDLSGANLTNGNFENVSFINAKLDDVIWAGANITGASFDEGVLEKIQAEL